MALPGWLDGVDGAEADRLSLRLLLLALDIGRMGGDAADVVGRLVGGEDRDAVQRAVGRCEGIHQVHGYVIGLVEQLHARAHPGGGDSEAAR